MPVPVVQIRGVRVRVDEGRVAVRMRVPARRLDARLVGVDVMLVVGMGVIVLDLLVSVFVRVGLVQEDPQARRHDPHGQKIDAA